MIIELSKNNVIKFGSLLSNFLLFFLFQFRCGLFPIDQMVSIVWFRWCLISECLIEVFRLFQTQLISDWTTFKYTVAMICIIINIFTIVYIMVNLWHQNLTLEIKLLTFKICDLSNLCKSWHIARALSKSFYQ